MTAVLQGADAFQRDLRASVQDLGNLSSPMRSTSSTIQRAGQARAPKMTGRLANSLVARADPMTAEVSSTLVYAGVIHWGWPGHNIEPQPFLTTAAQDTEPQWLREFDQYVDRTINQMDKVYA